MASIQSWLASYQLDRYTEVFEANEVELEDLPALTHDDLRDGLGLSRLRDRKQILEAIATWVEHQDVQAKPVVYPEGLDAAQMPTYLAHPWHALCAEDHPRVKLHWLTDTAELAVRWVVSVALAEILHANDLVVPKKLAKLIRNHIERPTLGRWLGVLRELSNNPPASVAINADVFKLYSESFEPRFDGDTLETSLLMLRNQIAHGGGMSQSHAQELLGHQLPTLSELLREVLATTSQGRVLALDGDHTHLLRGLEPRETARPEALADTRDGAWLVHESQALPLLPLAIYEPVKMIDSAGELRPRPGGAAPQIFTRAHTDRLSYTPLGRDEAHSEVLEVEPFREIFRLDEKFDDRPVTALVDGVSWDDALNEARSVATDLVGRGAEIKHIKKWLKGRNSHDEEQANIGWISGGPGLGKSMVMARLASDYGAGSHRGFYFHKFGGGGNARSNRRAFLKFLQAALWSWKPLRELTAPPDWQQDGDDLIDALEARLAKLAELEAPHPKAPRPAFWIFIDNFDEVIEQDPRFLDLVRKFAIPGTIWLLCGRPEHGLDEEFSTGRAEHVFEGGLPVMSADDIRAMLIEGLGNARYALLRRDEDDEDGVHNAFVERVVERARGLPLYVELLLADLRAGRITVEDDDKLPDGLSAYYDGLMKRGSLSTVSRDLPLIVSILARAEEPLDVDAFAGLLAPQLEDIEGFVERVRAALRVGQSLLRTSTTPAGTTGYSLYHQSFREYVGGRPASRELPATPPTPVIAQTVYEAERLLYRSAERWDELPAGNLRNHLFRWGTTYALDLQGDAGLAEARARLTSYSYLHARVEALPPEAVVDLVSEYGELIRRTPSGPERDELMIWEAFFRERAHILARGEDHGATTRALLQLALEHADTSPVTLAAEAWVAEGNASDWLLLRKPTRPRKLKENFALRVFEGHRERVEGAAVLPDRRVLSWSIDHTLRLWSLDTGEELEALEGHEASVDGAMVTDERAISWARDGGLITWRLDTGELEHQLVGHEKAILGAAVLDGGRLLSWSEDKSLRTWDLSEGDPLEVMTGHTRPLRGAMLLPGDRILSWSDDKTLRIWSQQGGEALVTLKGHTREVTGAIYLEGGRILSWDMDNVVRLWREDGEELAAFEGHEDTPLGAMLLEDETFLTWGKDATIRRWSADGELLATLEGHSDWVDGLMMLGEDRALSWSKDMNLILWDLERGKKLETLEGHAGWVRGVARLSTGELLSWAGGGTLRIWNIDAPAGEVELLAVLEGHTAGVRGACELEDESLLSWSWDGSMRLWEWEREDDITESIGHRGWILGHTRWDDDHTLSWSSDALAILWDNETGRPTVTFAGHEKSIGGVTRLRDGRLLTHSSDYTMRIWDPATGESVAEMEGHSKKIQGVSELADGRVLSWSSDATLKVWSPTDGACELVLEDHKKLIQGARQLEDGRVISWSSDATIKLWDLDAGELALDLTEHKKLIKGVRLLEGGRALSYSSDKTLKVWDLETGDCLMTLEGHKKLVQDARLLDAHRAASFGKDNLIIVWDLAEGTELLRIDAGDEVADGATLLDDGTLLTWFRKAKRFRQWELEGGELVGEISYDDAMLERPDLWRARQLAGHFDTLQGSWRAHGVSGGALLFLDREDGAPAQIAWRDSGSWVSLVLTGAGVLGVHAGQYFHPLHLFRGTERVSLAEAAAALGG